MANDFIKISQQWKKKIQRKTVTTMLPDYCWTIPKNAPEQPYKRQAKKSKTSMTSFFFTGINHRSVIISLHLVMYTIITAVYKRTRANFAF